MSQQAFIVEISRYMHRLIRNYLDNKMETIDIILSIAKLFNLFEKNKISGEGIADTLFNHIVPPLLETVPEDDIYIKITGSFQLFLELKTKYCLDLVIDNYNLILNNCFILLGKYLNMSIEEIRKEYGSQIHSLNASTTVKVVKTLQNGQKEDSKISGITIGNLIPQFIEKFKQEKEKIKKSFPPSTGDAPIDTQIIIINKVFLESNGIQLDPNVDSDFYIEKKIEKEIMDYLK